MHFTKEVGKQKLISEEEKMEKPQEEFEKSLDNYETATLMAELTRVDVDRELAPELRRETSISPAEDFCFS